MLWVGLKEGRQWLSVVVMPLEARRSGLARELAWVGLDGSGWIAVLVVSVSSTC